MENLRRIGRVLHTSPSKKAVVKAESIPRIGETVLNEKNRYVGKVFDVFGPTVSPYVSVEVNVKNPENLVNHILYAFPPSKNRMKGDMRR